MARPDVRDKRRDQLLDAFEEIVARNGIEGATLARTAEVAGLARPLIRHNIGNREDLVAALVERFLEKSRDAMDGMLNELPPEKAIHVLVDWLFDKSYSDPQLVRISSALITASADDPRLARKMRSWLREFIDRITFTLSASYPDAGKDRVDAVATGLTGIYFNIESLYPLGDIQSVSRASRNAAMLLVTSLETKNVK